ncbi:hypothetical protein CANDROIZ_50046 [Candidatus Roizmanbacteria bacterium]|nr:hypothetical protein CANDROIZ_50046 [Candidatus Roizmanbacteria bacterium]
MKYIQASVWVGSDRFLYDPVSSNKTTAITLETRLKAIESALGFLLLTDTTRENIFKHA